MTNWHHLEHLLGWLMEQLDSRPPRERRLMLGVLLMLTLWVADACFLTPAFAHMSSAGLAAQQVASEQAALEQQRAQARNQAQNAAQNLGAELAAWQQRVQQDQAQLARRGATGVPADAMITLLSALLQQHRAITLIGMRDLPEVPLAAASEPALLYRHGVELTVQGRYADLLAYCRALEALPQHLLWGDMHLAAEDYPRVTLTLTISTLSQDKPWLKL